MPDDDYRLDDQIGFVLRLAVQFHTAIFTSRTIEGLTQTQFAALATIHQVEPCTQSDLTKLLALDSATVNGVVERVHARGFIRTAEDPEDRRRQTLRLTPQGHAVAMAAIAIARDITAETVARLTPAQEARLLLLLRTMMGRTPGAAAKPRSSALRPRR